MINKLVSVDNVILNLLDDMGLDHNKFKPMFVNWAVTAEKKISSYYQYERKRTVLTINKCIAILPDDACVLELALLGDYGCDCGDLMTQVCGSIGNVQSTAGNYDSTSFLVVDLPSTDYALFGFVDHAVQDDKIIFNSNYDGQSVTIQYLGLVVDANGVPKVNQNHLEAISEYCQWKYKRRNPKSGIDIGIYRDHKREFEELAACARADDNEMTSSQKMSVANIINDPFAGRGLILNNGAY